MRAAAVIPVGAGREENLLACLGAIGEMTVKPPLVVVVLDGETGLSEAAIKANRPFVCHVVQAPKHEPGLEQPRNYGVRRIEAINAKIGAPITHAWFLDSDILIAPDALERYIEAMGDANRVLVGPYDWLPGGVRERVPELRNDPRWASFDTNDPQKVLVDDLSAGLACFSGNLVWPIDEFTRIGGFWDELHHGRCEDGELGLRAVACGVPISYVRGARGWHLDHPRDYETILRRNERDVPMLNNRHPWVAGICQCGHAEADHDPNGVRPCCACDCAKLDKKVGLFVVEEDGKRFNVQCRCGWSGNTAEIWEHQSTCTS